MKMSYSPFAVLGTQMQIQKNRERIEKYRTNEKTENDEQNMDYTEMLRKTYFPHLIEKIVDK